MTTASFVTDLQTPRELSVPVPEFRAPPPSPVTGVLTSSSSGSPGYGECPDDNEDDEIGRFLRRYARVPVLRLPERTIPRKKTTSWTPPVIDMRLLASLETGAAQVAESLRSAAVSLGFFQVVGHGVDGGSVSAALRTAAPRAGMRSPASEETDASGEGDEDGEELWWPPSEEDLVMARWSWPLQHGANQCRNEANDLFVQLEKTATKIIGALQQGGVGGAGATENLSGGGDGERNGPLLCIRTHRRKRRGSSASASGSGPMSHDDTLRMLVRSSRWPRALALHLCPGASAFHVSSRRGWSRFRPLDGAVVVTVGDQLQAWSRGLYKSVAGKPAYGDDDLRGGNGGDDDVFVSAEFLHSCSPAKEPVASYAGKTIPLKLQIMVAACLVLVYRFLLPCLYAIW